VACLCAGAIITVLWPVDNSERFCDIIERSECSCCCSLLLLLLLLLLCVLCVLVLCVCVGVCGGCRFQGATHGT
jgi:hypothetical protein